MVVIAPPVFASLVEKTLATLGDSSTAQQRSPLDPGLRLETIREQDGGRYAFIGFETGEGVFTTYGTQEIHQVRAAAYEAVYRAREMADRCVPGTDTKYQHGNVILFPSFEDQYPQMSKFWETHARPIIEGEGFKLVTHPASEFMATFVDNPNNLFKIPGVEGSGATVLVIVEENLHGDIITDLVATGTGGPGFAGAVNRPTRRRGRVCRTEISHKR